MTTLVEIGRRFSRVPDALRETLERPTELPAPPRRLGAWSDVELGFDVTGVGASEFSARILVQVLGSAGVRARFVPISTFVSTTDVPDKSCLVVFSQGISPNARLALRAAPSYQASFLFSGDQSELPKDLSEFSAGCHEIYRHPPASESGSLLRILGPPCAALLALSWAARIIEVRTGSAPRWRDELALVPERYARASGVDVALGEDPAACIASGSLVALAPALMWKWQEALYAPLPPTFDLLAFAHGPLQSLASAPGVILALQPAAGDPLLTNLHEALDRNHHRIVELRATLPAPLSIFEHDAAVTSLALGEMRRRNIDPGNWPGRSEEKALYDVGRSG